MTVNNQPMTPEEVQTQILEQLRIQNMSKKERMRYDAQQKKIAQQAKFNAMTPFQKDLSRVFTFFFMSLVVWGLYSIAVGSIKNPPEPPAIASPVNHNLEIQKRTEKKNLISTILHTTSFEKCIDARNQLLSSS